jgi:hypothetical protein
MPPDLQLSAEICMSWRADGAAISARRRQNYGFDERVAHHELMSGH